MNDQDFSVVSGQTVLLVTNPKEHWRSQYELAASEPAAKRIKEPNE
ncbi:hypothetical protein [Methylomonas koyamae]|nr:hypothetical protein [Methylomonas koyamae]WNB74530.1 hypothetical protein RI210_14700 [Methylomonas koyamae]